MLLEKLILLSCTIPWYCMSSYYYPQHGPFFHLWRLLDLFICVLLVSQIQGPRYLPSGFILIFLWLCHIRFQIVHERWNRKISLFWCQTEEVHACFFFIIICISHALLEYLFIYPRFLHQINLSFNFIFLQTLWNFMLLKSP